MVADLLPSLALASDTRHLGEKAFTLEVAIRSPSSCQERQGFAGIAPQMPGAAQTHHAEKEQRQEGLAAGGRGGMRLPQSRLLASGKRLLQSRDQARLVSGGE